VLDQVRTRRAEQVADSIFDSAKSKLDAKAITDAIPLLRQYAADPHATKKAEAQKLLAECDIATSETAALQSLIEISDVEFQRVTNSGKLEDGKVTHPVLVLLRNELIRRNVDKAAQQRDAIRVAKEKQLKAERLAAEIRQRSEAEKLAAEALLRAEQDKPSDGTQLFAKITTFPERYMGKNFYIDGVLYPRSSHHSREFKCFAIQFDHKTRVSGGPHLNRLSFITSEDMGTKLLEDDFSFAMNFLTARDYHAVIHVHLRYLDENKKQYPVGYITKIDVINWDKVAGDFKSGTLLENGTIETHSKP
jgi:hypothetical protein